MSKDNMDQISNQVIMGIHRLCTEREGCFGCPFFLEHCVFDEPKPKTWFDEKKSVRVPPVPPVPPVPIVPEIPEPVYGDEVVEEPKTKETKSKDTKSKETKAKDDKEEDGTWLLSTTMGGLFTKYVYICSKCGYRKESVLAIAPVTFCPECEKRKAQNG